VAPREPIEITSGEFFRIEVDGELKPTRIEYLHHAGRGGEYSSVDGYELRGSLRAGIGGGE
jgi:hypothetical protein